MPELILPDARVHLSFLTAMKEFQAEGRGGPDDDHSMLGREIRMWSGRWEDPAEFVAYAAWSSGTRTRPTAAASRSS